MTKNQIEYQKVQEQSRANRAGELLRSGELSETRRSNQAREAETNRSNEAKEREQHRSAVAQEFEATRSHRASEGLEAQRNYETARSNQAREAETERANKAQEAELERSHRASETEANRSHLAQELETNRSNVRKENLTDQKQQLDWLTSESDRSQRQEAAELQANTQLATEEMRQTGQNQRQTKQLLYDFGTEKVPNAIKSFVELLGGNGK